MPEPPSFNAIAIQLMAAIGIDSDWGSEQKIAEHLRQVWNARGAADREGLIDPVTNAVDDWVRAGAGTYDELQAIIEQALTAALRSLNR